MIEPEIRASPREVLMSESLEVVPCDLCGSSKSTIVAKQRDLLHKVTDLEFIVVRCDQCGLHFTNPRPTQEIIGFYYPEAYSFHSISPKWRQWLDRILDLFANGPLSIFGSPPFLQRRLVSRVIPKLSDPVLEFYRMGGSGPFLDIGCGSGTHVHFWGKKSAIQTLRKFTEVFGVEISDISREYLVSSGIECWKDLESVPSNKRFAVIRMNWSLEHVHSPSTYFRFMGERLLPEGKIVISVPNYGGLIYRAIPDCVELPIHLYHFNIKDIESYARKYQMKVRKFKTFSYPNMFLEAAKTGLFPSGFPESMTVKEAKSALRFLSYFDAIGMGNDLLVELEHAR